VYITSGGQVYNRGVGQALRSLEPITKHHTIQPFFNHLHHHNMKFTSALLALLGSAAASPVALTESQELDHQLERRQAIGYVQNYNGNLANFKYNQGAGTFTANWNNPGDFVVGLGWNTGTANRYDYHVRW
jgi:hypothetical protein